MQNTNINYRNIKGWGVDADPSDNPNYPIKQYNGDDHRRLDWERPPLQPDTKVEVLKSVEHPRMPAVFGTKNPPAGFSGKLRRYAFTFSESEYGHWLGLLFADRVNVIEGLLNDLKRGYIPNVFSEKGINADWKYNRKELITKVAVVTAIAVAAGLFISRKKEMKKA